MPPYSDELDSGKRDVSDGGESFIEELSPCDGYFTRAEMPSDRLVPDPTVDYGPVEAKTLIDPPNFRPNSGSSSRVPLQYLRSPQLPSSPQHVSPSTMRGHPMSPVPQVSSHRRHGSFSENEPLMSHPPPAYSESPSQSPPPASNLSSRARLYSTFPEQHLERGFFIRREPESMGGPLGDPPTESTPLVRGGKFSPRRREIKALLFACLAVAIVGSTLAIVLGCAHSVNTGHIIDVNTDYCPAATMIEPQKAYEFLGGKELNIIHKIKEETDRGTPFIVSAEGEIRLRTAPENSTHGENPYITVDIGTSTNLTTILRWSKDSQTLELTTPRYRETYTARSQCMYVIITAWFPEDTEITHLRLNSPTLNLALSDVKVNVIGSSTFTTIVGDVWLTTGDEEESQRLSKSKHPALRSKPISENATSSEARFASRRTVVETVSGQITGTYPLLDELLISSQSGNIAVKVSPQPASKSAPAPADLEVQTASGSIRVDLPASNPHVSIPGKTFPSRDYITRVHSTSGSIFGTYYLGSESNFKTTSGNVMISTLPVLPIDDGTAKVPPNRFETHTVSGKTVISVLEPVFFSTPPPLDPSQVSETFHPVDSDDNIILPLVKMQEHSYKTSKLRSLRSTHSSNTGQIEASYPNAWQGSVHAKTVSGAIEINGEGFRTVVDRHGWAFREVEKRRGVDGKGEGSAVEMNNISGMVAFTVRE